MELMEHSYSVLLVSSSSKFNDSIRKLLPETRYGPVITAGSAASARRHLLERNFDIMIINAPLKDDYGTELALEVCESSGAGVLFFAKADVYHDVAASISPYGIIVVSKPAPVSAINQSLLILCGIRERLRRMEKKTATIEEKMEEIRIVNRAKLLLIEQLRMSEKEAHRYIEKCAMDHCVTRRDIAEKIISIYK
jgi:two-component system, response regulator PdtaR